MKVYLAQLLCPSRHCILAAAGEYESPEAAEELVAKLRAAFIKATRKHLVNPWCDLCYSRDLHIVMGPSKWGTLTEARPVLHTMEAEQHASAEFLKGSKS